MENKHEMEIAQLGDLQLTILRALWMKGEATVAELHRELEPERDLAVTTVATILSRLEKRGLVSHTARGRQFVYRPSVSEKEVRRSMLAELTERVFEGDVAALVNHLLTEGEIGPGDLEKVKSLIEDKEKERKPDDAD
jgi:BlaI family penicillinase repressor